MQCCQLDKNNCKLTGPKEFGPIGNRIDSVCLQVHGQVSRQPKSCRSAMLDPKGPAFGCVSVSLFFTKVCLGFYERYVSTGQVGAAV